MREGAVALDISFKSVVLLRMSNIVPFLGTHASSTEKICRKCVKNSYVISLIGNIGGNTNIKHSIYINKPSL